MPHFTFRFVKNGYSRVTQGSVTSESSVTRLYPLFTKRNSEVWHAFRDYMCKEVVPAIVHSDNVGELVVLFQSRGRKSGTHISFFPPYLIRGQTTLVRTCQYHISDSLFSFEENQKKKKSSNGSTVFLVTHGAKEKCKGGTAPSRSGSIWPSTTIRVVLGTLLLLRSSRHTINGRLAINNQKPHYVKLIG